MSDQPCIGVVALARPTFDVPFAEATARNAFGVLDSPPVKIVGSRKLLFDADATEAAIASLAGEEFDMMLVLQVTYTDASMTVALADKISAPLTLWAFPEPRARGRLGKARVGLIGDHPVGFDTCSYDRGELAALTGVQVEQIDLEALFGAARAAPAAETRTVRKRAEAEAGRA